MMLPTPAFLAHKNMLIDANNHLKSLHGVLAHFVAAGRLHGT